MWEKKGRKWTNTSWNQSRFGSVDSEPSGLVDRENQESHLDPKPPPPALNPRRSADRRPSRHSGKAAFSAHPALNMVGMIK